MVYPYLNGHNLWWACALSKGADGFYHDTRGDAEHEGQNVPDPQIGLAFAARTLQAQLLMAKYLGLTPPPLLADIAANLAPFNTANWSFVPPSNDSSFVVYENQRFSGDNGMHLGVATLEECEALCASLGDCALFTFCPNTTVPTCDDGESCWQFTADKFQTLHAGPGFTSGKRNGTAPDAQTLTVWSAFANATVGESDSFAIYPSWPTEFLASTGAPMDAATAAIAQASSRAYVSWDGGRTVDVFSSAVFSGLGYNFAHRPGGSVATQGPPAPAVAFSPAEVVAGFNVQLRDLGGNLLIYAPGGGVENIGASRAVNDMLATSIGGLGGAIMIFGFWPASEPASFHSLLVKGGFAVSASFSNATQRVASPVVISAQYTWAQAAQATARLYEPFGVGSSGGITATCGGVSAPLTWVADALGAIMSFSAPLGVDCLVALP